MGTVAPETPARLSAHLATVGPTVMPSSAGQKEQAQPRPCFTPRVRESGAVGRIWGGPAHPCRFKAVLALFGAGYRARVALGCTDP